VKGLAIGLSYGALGWQFWSILTIIDGGYDRATNIC